MEKIKCVMENKETRTLVLVLFGILAIHLAMCMLKTHCRKKKKTASPCSEC